MEEIMHYWWVNQNQTYKEEIPGGFMWSPKRKTDGARNQFYENMTEAQPGDMVFSFCDTKIKAIGIVTGHAESCSKPDFNGAGDNWSDEGWYVPVEYKELQSQIKPKLYIADLLAHLPKKYSPLQQNGNGLQSVYLASVPRSMADVLIAKIGPEFIQVKQALHEHLPETSEDDKEESSIEERTDIGDTKRKQLIYARRGQGQFKSNVRLHEQSCRVTGITNLNHLIASHIKPWRVSSDLEKLSGSNGFLLAPHVDHLFDKGYISFDSNGGLLISASLDANLLTSWGLKANLNVGSFTNKQQGFLDYHRAKIFKGTL
jgi:putative restriction endonuclease